VFIITQNIEVLTLIANFDHHNSEKGSVCNFSPLQIINVIKTVWLDEIHTIKPSVSEPKVYIIRH
jgi:hypothetical protein